jgi:sugar lactone lactonase YvrE
MAAAVIAALCAACSGSDHPTYQVETLVPGSLLHAPNGITFGPDGMLYAGSVGAQTVYRIDVSTGAVEVVVGAPDGEADDVAFSPGGTLVWTALIGGEIRALREDGTVDVVVTKMPLINPVYFTRDGRLFAAQIGLDRLHEFPVDAMLNSTGKPRLIASKIGNLNSFEITAEGDLYGPLSSIGVVAHIDIESGTVTPIAENLGTVVAVNLDSKGSIWAVDWAGGNLWRIDPDGSEWHAPQLVATLDPPLDNLAIGPDDTVYVSRPAHSAIDRVDPATGKHDSLITGQLASPGGIAIMTHDGRESLLVADGYGYRVVDTQTGAVTTTFDITEFGFPGAATAAAANDDFFGLTDALTRPRVYVIDRATGKSAGKWRGMKTPVAILLRENGDPVVADFETGRLIGLSRTDKKQLEVLAEDLDGPAGLAWAGPNSVYVTEALAGTLAWIDLADGSKTIVATGLSLPEGVTTLANGDVAVVEVGKRRLIEIDPESGDIEALASDLPVGERAANAPEPIYLPSGVAQGADGSLYVTGDLDNSILKLTVR